MGDTSTTVGWICVGPSHLQATRAHLEDPQVDDAASNLVGSIGGAEVIVVGVPTLASLRTRDAWTRLQAAASRAGKQRIDGVIITSTLADPQPSALPAPGDVVISPCSGGGGGHGAAQSSLADILRRALHVLRSEMGEDGRWLAPGGVRPGPRLHYLESFEDECLKEVAACTSLAFRKRKLTHLASILPRTFLTSLSPQISHPVAFRPSPSSRPAGHRGTSSSGWRRRSSQRASLLDSTPRRMHGNLLCS